MEHRVRGILPSYPHTKELLDQPDVIIDLTKRTAQIKHYREARARMPELIAVVGPQSLAEAQDRTLNSKVDQALLADHLANNAIAEQINSPPKNVGFLKTIGVAIKAGLPMGYSPHIRSERTEAEKHERRAGYTKAAINLVGRTALMAGALFGLKLLDTEPVMPKADSAQPVFTAPATLPTPIMPAQVRTFTEEEGKAFAQMDEFFAAGGTLEEFAQAADYAWLLELSEM